MCYKFKSISGKTNELGYKLVFQLQHFPLSWVHYARAKKILPFRCHELSQPLLLETWTFRSFERKKKKIFLHVVSTHQAPLVLVSGGTGQSVLQFCVSKPAKKNNMRLWSWSLHETREAPLDVDKLPQKLDTRCRVCTKCSKIRAEGFMDKDMSACILFLAHSWTWSGFFGLFRTNFSFTRLFFAEGTWT